MFGGVKVLSGVLIFRVITATNMAASQTKSQVDPIVAHFQALLATIWSFWDYIFIGLFDVLAGIHFLIINHDEPIYFVYLYGFRRFFDRPTTNISTNRPVVIASDAGYNTVTRLYFC